MVRHAEKFVLQLLPGPEFDTAGKPFSNGFQRFLQVHVSAGPSIPSDFSANLQSSVVTVGKPLQFHLKFDEPNIAPCLFLHSSS